MLSRDDATDPSVELAKLKDQIRRLVPGRTRDAVRGGPPERLKALRIRLRTFLDAHRRTLPHSDAVALRTWIEDIDRILPALSARRRA